MEQMKSAWTEWLEIDQKLVQKWREMRTKKINLMRYSAKMTKNWAKFDQTFRFESNDENIELNFWNLPPK